jgi:hypothetical protein
MMSSNNYINRDGPSNEGKRDFCQQDKKNILLPDRFETDELITSPFLWVQLFLSYGDDIIFSPHSKRAGVAELVDARDLKSSRKQSLAFS